LQLLALYLLFLIYAKGEPMTSFIDNTGNNVSHLALSMTCGTLVGVFCTRTFLHINPLYGGILCATIIVVKNLFMDRLFNSLFHKISSSPEKRLIQGLGSLAASTAVAALFSTVIGFPISFGGGMILWGSCLAGAALTVAILAATQLASRTVR
jgi:hypothetical protein